MEPSIPVGYLCAPDQALLLRRAWFRHLLQPQALHPDYRMVDDEYERRARDRGYRIHVWTAHEPEEMRRLTQLGVDLIITNRPELLRASLEMNQKRCQRLD